MTGKELLEALQAMTPEELEREVVTRHWDAEGSGYVYESGVDVKAASVVATEVPLLWIELRASRHALIPVIEIG